jgi:phosphoglycerate dehydrogenase-like enzyme
MAKPLLVFVTERGPRHQDSALKVAPGDVEVTMLRSPDPDELKQALATARYLVSERRGRIGADVMAAAPDLRLILRLGALTHDIDLDAARARAIMVCQRRQEGAMRVAEHVVLQMLALVWRLDETQAVARAAAGDWAARRRTDEDQFAYNWSKRQDLPGVGGKTVGILGFGEIGVELARRLAGWDCRLVYGRRHPLPGPVEGDLGLTHAGNESLIAGSDVLVNLLPFTPETAGYLDRRRLSSMKPGAFLVSAGSGGIIDEAALADLVRGGDLAGAALDTFAVEPIEADNPLVALARDGANLVLTPHIAGGAPADIWDEYAAMYDAIRDHLLGREPAERIA